MPWIGDIHVPLLTNKDTSVDKNTIEKNFVDSPPSIYELNKNIESGTYSAYLHEKVHERNESLEEQSEAIRSLVDRHPVECTYSDSREEGYLVVEGSSVIRTPDISIREMDIDVRFMDNDVYKPAFNLESEDTNSAFPLPSVADVNQSVLFTLGTRDGDIDFYEYSSTLLEYDIPESDFNGLEKTSPVRFYRESDDTLDNISGRVYKDYSHLPSTSVVENGNFLARFLDSGIELSYYSDGWNFSGNISYSSNLRYTEEVSNSHSEISLEDVQGYFYRGYPIMEFDVSNTTSFGFTLAEGIQNETDGGDYLIVEDFTGVEYFYRAEDENVVTNTDTVDVEGMSDTEEYKITIGKIPSNIDSHTFVDYSTNIGNWKETLIQR